MVKLNLSDKAKNVIGTVAPALGTALGGPLGGLAGLIIAQVVGGGDAKKVEEAIIAQKPETLLALKQAEQNYLLRLEELGIERERIEQADRASARQRETGTGDGTVRILAYTIVGSFIAMIGGVLFGQLTVDSALAGSLIGYLSAKAEQVVAYYFGSSLGSKLKTNFLGKET
jgi:hypothetical protein